MDTPRRTEHRYRVRFDEADMDEHLRPSGLLRYTQDVAWRHSEEAGFDRDWHDARAMHWLVRNVSLRIHRAATQGDVLTISTEVIGWRQMWARRRTELRRGDEPIASVDTDWVLLREDGRPARVLSEVASYFSPGQAFRRRRILLPTPTTEPTTLFTRVRPIDVDPLRHMNNAAYLDVVGETLARMPEVTECGRPDRYEVGYVRPAQAGARIEVACWPAGEDVVACRLSDDSGEELARVMISWPER